MAFTADDLTIVEDAIRRLAQGKRVTELRFSDRLMRYESATMDDLLKLRDQIRAEVQRAGPRRSRVSRLYHGGRGV